MEDYYHVKEVIAINVEINVEMDSLLEIEVVH